MHPCLFGQFRPVLDLFLNFVRKKERKKEERTQLAFTRVAGSAATKNKDTREVPRWLTALQTCATFPAPVVRHRMQIARETDEEQ